MKLRVATCIALFAADRAFAADPLPDCSGAEHHQFDF